MRAILITGRKSDGSSYRGSLRHGVLKPKDNLALREAQRGRLIVEPISVHRSGKRKFREPAVEKAVNLALSKVGSNWREVLEELLLDRLLVKTGSTLMFPHLSVQEYHAARELLTDPTSNRRDETVRLVLEGQSWWEGVLRFYMELAGKPVEIREWLKIAGERVTSGPGTAQRLSRLIETAGGIYPDLVTAPV